MFVHFMHLNTFFITPLTSIIWSALKYDTTKPIISAKPKFTCEKLTNFWFFKNEKFSKISEKYFVFNFWNKNLSSTYLKSSTLSVFLCVWQVHDVTDWPWTVMVHPCRLCEEWLKMISPRPLSYHLPSHVEGKLQLPSIEWFINRYF